MNRYSQIVIIIITLIFISSCKTKQDKNNLLDGNTVFSNKYEIDFESKGKSNLLPYSYFSSIYSKVGVGLSRVIYRKYEFGGKRIGYILFTDGRFITQNDYFENYLIQYDLTKDTNKTKANYIIWRNDRGRDEWDDKNIDSTTVSLITNIDSLIIKKWYPDLKCKVTRKMYKKITFDLSFPENEMRFYHNIEFIE